MAQHDNIRKIKSFIKVSVIVCILVVFVVFGIFIRPTHTFENAKMKKWLVLSNQQRMATVNQIVKDNQNPDLLIKCVTKIADLPNSDEMAIRDGIAICYNGIKINTVPDEK